MVELMMVILIIALLAALLTNAVQSSREMARRTQCVNRMREVGMAAIDFETRNSGYPGWLHSYLGPANPPPPRRFVNSWIYQLLPGLGRGDLTDESSPAWDPLTRVALNELLVCPSHVEKTLLTTPQSPTSFVCNAGRRDAQPPAAGMSADWRSNAVFVNRNDRDANGLPVKVEVTDASFITKNDGLGFTLLLSENVDARTWYNTNPYPPDETVNCIVFWPPDGSGNFPPENVHRINGPKDSASDSYDVARPSSFHPGGVNMFFCGGQGRFVSDRMDYRIYCAIMTPRGASAMEPGTQTPSAPQITNQPQVTEDALQ
jgi:type II secretory pathway pseudopilin PulG